MTNEAIRSLVDVLLTESPESSDRDDLARLVSLNAKLQSFAAHYAMRCTRRANELAAEGRSEDGFAMLLNAGNGSTLDAKAAGERDRACATVPGFDDALADGAVSPEHVDLLARHTKDLDESERAEVAATADELLSAAAGSTWMFERQLKQLVATIKARHRARSDAEELERQRAASSIKQWTEQGTGMKCTLIKLDPVRDTQFHNVVAARLAQLKQDPANAKMPFEQLKITALLDCVTGQAPAMGAPEIVIHVDAATAQGGRHEHTMCETIDGTPVPFDTMRRLCCDAILHAAIIEPDGTVRRLARLRTPNRAQRRALAAMYSTCAHPDCTVTFDDCKIHHIVWYSRGGKSLLDNLLPLCERHHHLVHEGGWQLSMTPDRMLTWYRPDGTIWVTHLSANRRRERRRPAA